MKKIALALSVLLMATASAAETPQVDPVARAWQIIDEAKNGSVEQRRMLAMAASLGGARPKVFSYLSDTLEDKEPEVRMAACMSLASIKDKDSIEPLKKALADSTPEVAFCAAQALWNLNDPVGKEVMLAILGGGKTTGTSYLSNQSQQAMRTFKSKKAFFSTLFRVGVMVAPVPGLGMGISSYQGLTKDKNVTGRALAALALATGTDAESFEALRSALKDKDPTVRAAAVHSLALRNNPTVREDLVPLLEDKKEMVRYRAAVAYLRLNKIEEEMRSGDKK